MAFEMQDNSGSIFVNERKTTAKHPDRNGSCMIDGTEYWVAGWIKEGKDGKKRWLSLSFTAKDSDGSTKTTTSRKVDEDFSNDDIPF